MSYRDGADTRIYEYDSSLVAAWNPKVFYCFQKTKTSPSQRYRLHLPNYLFPFVCFLPSETCQVILMGLERLLEEEVTALICYQACSGCLSKLSFIRKNFLQMFDPKGHVPSSSFPRYLTLSGLLSARDRQQPLIRFSQQPAISIWHYSNICSVTMTNTCSGTVAHADERKHCDSRASVLSEHTAV